MASEKKHRQQPISPLQAMTMQAQSIDEIDSLSPTPIVSRQTVSPSHDHIDAILDVDPERICNWQYSDRPNSELGDLETFANELKIVGQQNPCIVRPYTLDRNYDYEIIAGERRWRAAKIAGIKLKILVRPLSDNEAALCQVAENSNRKDISEFAKGTSYAKLVNKGIITRDQIQAKLSLSKSSIRNLLSFEKILPEICEAIGDMSKVSSSTAYELARLQDKGKNYVSAIISIASKLSSGKIGHQKLQELVEAQITNNTTAIQQAKEVHTKNGRHIFTWRKDTNGNRSITFPKNIRNHIDFDKLEPALIEIIDKQLKDKDSLG